MKFKEDLPLDVKIRLALYRAYMIFMDALLGYPKERTWYPEGKEVRIRHKDGVWTLKPAATYCRRMFSPIKTEHRRGWEIVDAPESMAKHIGTINLTESPGEAIHNILWGYDIMHDISHGA